MSVCLQEHVLAPSSKLVSAPIPAGESALSAFVLPGDAALPHLRPPSLPETKAHTLNTFASWLAESQASCFNYKVSQGD